MRRAVQAGWSRRACRLQFAATAILWTATGARAQTQAAPQAAPEIKAIEVEGNRHVPTDQILTWLALRPGDRFDPARVSRAVRELSTKKRFKDVRAEGERVEGGVTLHVIVEELPYLQEVRIDGAKNLKEKEIRDAMRLASGSFLAPAALRSDRDKIVDLYREKGYYQVAVDDSLAGAPGEPQILLLRVREGEKGSVKTIEFVGNTHASTKELRKAMETRVDGLVSGGELKDAVLREDFERVAGHYRSLGYLDAQVTGHEIVVGPNGRDLIIRITVNEGELYKAGLVTWSGNKAFDDDAIRRLIQLRLGLPFDETKYEATTAALAEMYNDAGYIQFNAVPRRDVRDRVVNVHYDLTEGEVAHVHHIRVLGNTKTQDKVILREFLVAPGDTFDRSKLLRSIREVYALGFFEDAGIERVVPRDDGSVDLELRVARAPDRPTRRRCRLQRGQRHHRFPRGGGDQSVRHRAAAFHAVGVQPAAERNRLQLHPAVAVRYADDARDRVVQQFKTLRGQ